VTCLFLFDPPGARSFSAPKTWLDEPAFFEKEMEVADDVKEHSVKMKFSFARPAARFDLSCIAF
jgi:hypothetical protein